MKTKEDNFLRVVFFFLFRLLAENLHADEISPREETAFLQAKKSN